eukprot:1293075-Rhodomonas_salina.2
MHTRGSANTVYLLQNVAAGDPMHTVEIVGSPSLPTKLLQRPTLLQLSPTVRGFVCLSPNPDSLNAHHHRCKLCFLCANPRANP